MRRVLLAIGLLVFASSLRAAETCSANTLPVCVALDAVTSTGASSTVNTFGHRNLSAQVWSAAGSVATVNIECRSAATAPWFACASVVNPTQADVNGEGGAYITLPRSYQYRVNVIAYTSGNISATIERYNQ